MTGGGPAPRWRRLPAVGAGRLLTRRGARRAMRLLAAALTGGSLLVLLGYAQ
jgi:hypothetical protein